ncbi:MAG: BatD family protein [bacterium]|nr:BatD family protein [bacterium]
MRFLFLIATLSSTCSLLAQNSVNLTINPGTAEVGETFEITVTSTKSGNVDFGELPDAFVQDYAIQQGTSQYQAPNGKMTVQHYYTISGIIKKPGNYTFGPVTVTSGNKTYTSNKVMINISKKVKMQGGHLSSRQLRDPAFGLIEVNKTTLYEGEPLLVRAKIYARYKPTHINNYQPYDMNGALIKHSVGNNSQLKTVVEQFHGENLYAIDYDKNVLFPSTVGKIKIEPYKLSLHQGYQNFPVESSTMTVNILPLPANPPNDFIGAVGSFDVNRTLSETEFDQGDVITMTVEVSGIGNLHNITAPQLNLPKGFSQYGDPKITEEFSIGVRGSEGKITYEYNIEVVASGQTTLPPTSITYFDPNTGSYVTTESTEDSLDIKPVDGVIVENSDDNSDKRTNELVVQEFNPRENGGSVAPGSIFGTTLFWGSVSIPLTSAFLFLLFVKSRKTSEERKEEKLRKHAQSSALSAKIQAVHIAAQSNDTAAFYDAVDKLLRSAYGVALNKQDEIASKQEIMEHAAQLGGSTKEHTATLFSNIEVAKFSFGSDSIKHQEDLKLLENVLSALKVTK